MKIYLYICLLCSIIGIAYSQYDGYDVVRHYKDLLDTDKLSKQCQKSLRLFMINLNQSEKSDGDIWALQMFDATSKNPVGLFSYQASHLGNFEECTEIYSQKQNIMGKYCLGKISNLPDDTNFKNEQNRLYLKTLKKRLSGGWSVGEITSWAVCLPSNCTNDDVMQIMNITDKFGLKTSSVFCQTKDETYPKIDRDAIIGIAIFSILLMFTLVSTTLEIYFLYNGNGKVKQIYTMFSLYKNGKALFKVPNRTTNLTCLDGMRVINMLWIMLLHLYNRSVQQPSANSSDIVNFEDSLPSMLVGHATFACDSFFVIGGTLVTYVYFKKEKREKFTLQGVLKYYLHRYIRLTPALAAMVLFSATLLKYMGSGPGWDFVISSSVNPCKTNWWATLLYIRNHFSGYDFCLPHSWYLNVDMQLYILSPLILILLNHNSKIGIGAIVIAICSSVALSFYKGYIYEFSAILSNRHFRNSRHDYMEKYYLKTETRAGVWLLGTILGYLLTRKKYTDVKITKKYLIPLWTITLSMLFLCLIGGQETLRGERYDRILNSVYTAFDRPAFSIAICLLIWICSTNNGGIINTFLSNRIFQFLNKFILSMYITHLVFLDVIFFSTKTAIYFSVFNIILWFGGLFMFVFLLSSVWLLLFEIPVVALEKCWLK